MLLLLLLLQQQQQQQQSPQPPFPFLPGVRYIHNPVLFDRPGIGKVKFDVRYILLLSQAKPELELYAYNRFWLR